MDHHKDHDRGHDMGRHMELDGCMEHGTWNMAWTDSYGGDEGMTLMIMGT